MRTTEWLINAATEANRAMLFYLLTLISIAFFLYSGEVSRNAYYLLTYLALPSACWLVWRDKKVMFYWVPTLLLLLGLSKWLWSVVTTNQQLPLIAEHYRISGKRMILGAFVLYVIQRLSPQWRFSPRLIQGGTLLLCLMVIVVTLTGVLDFLHTGDRPKINSDAATSGAYMFTLLALVTLWSIRQSFPGHALLPSVFIALVAFVLLAVAETRSALLLFGLFCLATIVWHIAHGSHKLRAFWLGLIVLLLIAGFGAQKYMARVVDRIETVKTEIELYQQGDPSTSIGGRIGMWQAGMWAFTQHPLGQSADSRNQQAKLWLDTHQPGNAIAYLNIQYHTHNDLVESFSLQGIPGGVIMIAFMLALLLVPVTGKQRHYEGLLLAVPVIYFSMGDAQFYNRESPYFILLIWGYFLMVRRTSDASIPYQDSSR